VRVTTQGLLYCSTSFQGTDGTGAGLVRMPASCRRLHDPVYNRLAAGSKCLSISRSQSALAAGHSTDLLTDSLQRPSLHILAGHMHMHISKQGCSDAFCDHLQAC